MSQNQFIIINTPPTTTNTLIFPIAGNKFDSSFYFPSLTDGRVSSEEINLLLTELVATGAPTAVQLKKIENWFKTALFFFFLFFILSIALLALYNPCLIPFDIVGFFIIAACIVELGVMKFRRVRGKLRAKCEAIVQQHNQNLAPRGLRWHLPILFPSWVELWKDYQANNNMYAPPSQYS